ncbi:hypothetical protein NXY11_06525 [Parabacteroides faecis]|uniref:hypothetical protein n=1 Tax=Parabacteroides faecis TaxID=1217282 RepID=UPI002164CB1F|nr:hypothetical protein [Parabacteroides faecis]MCS2893522.1 hypothetical protein [Parabacteroides faecis]UVQ47880.1 hypothetical protein NXY11_06525 [Parabacteroides faecis]
MIAQTILQQIGGRRFSTMTGSKNFIDLGNGLRMNLTRNKTSANRLEIILDRETDTYTMKFYRQTFSKKTFEVSKKDIALHEGVYCDMLEEMFTSTTGLYTRL